MTTQHPTLKGNVLITGGAGFLGRGILNRARREGWDARFTIYSRDPQKQAHAKSLYPEAVCVLGDILDVSRMNLLMSNMDTVIHAAALKHLPECEKFPSQAISVNYDGSCSVMAAATASQVDRVACISTDKAAAPKSTYGMTKALIERKIFETLDLPSQTTFTAVRYGNVIGSTGSVWHAFKHQAATQGTLAVTDPRMTRFFLSIDEAVDAVLHALQAPAGTITVPRARALNIGDLANHLTTEWNLKPAVAIGQRPGEKGDETMVDASEFNRIVASHADERFYLLYGPMAVANSPITYPTPTSADADIILPSEFVELATASEDI